MCALSVMMLASGGYRYDVFGIADLMVQHLRRSRVLLSKLDFFCSDDTVQLSSMLSLVAKDEGGDGK